MENLIASSEICNRKIILEIRFKPNPLVLDKRGEIITKLVNADIIKNAHWELGNGDIRLLDDLDKDIQRNIVFININRLSIISSKVDSNDSFFNQAEKSFKVLKDLVGTVDVTRVGCRILGTYKSKSNQYSDIIENFKKYFNSNIFLEEFQARDLMFSIVYDNGRYVVGPINKNDSFLEKEFSYEDSIKSVGFGIDTDNFYLNDTNESVGVSKIRDVFVASLSVENSLFNKLSKI